MSTELPQRLPVRERAAAAAAPPLVSVSILTYNQRELVGRAIDSVLAQRVDFPLEIIIGDDCSDDGTQAVLRSYQSRYPDLIHLVLHPRRYDNVPGRINNLTNLRACRGKYTAMLDGDDYWTDPDKLQRQFERMESDATLSMCLHDTRFEYADTMPVRHSRPQRVVEGGTLRHSGVYHHTDLATGDRLSVHISSIFFRTGIYGELPDWFYEILPADRALLLLISQRGAFYYDARPQSVYYRNGLSFTATAYNECEQLYRRLADVRIFADHFPAMRASGATGPSTAWLHYRLLRCHFRAGGYSKIIRPALDMLRADPTFLQTLLANAWTAETGKWRQRAARLYLGGRAFFSFKTYP